MRIEALERREVFTTTLAPIANVTLLAGAPLHIALDGGDTEGDALSYTVNSSNSAVSLLNPEGNRSLKISVTHASSGAGDAAFSGDMVLQLFEDRAPRTTARIIQQAQSGLYNGEIFHRVINGFMIQGGDPDFGSTAQPPPPHGTGIKFDDEFSVDLQHTSSGLLSMAKSDDDTNDTQFFITEVPTRWLDFNHSVFGRLVEGDDIREMISNVPVTSNVPKSPVTTTSISVITDTQNRVLTLSAPPGTTGTSVITVTASDGHGGTATQTFNVTIAADVDEHGVPINGTPFLQPIADVVTTVNTPVSFQLPGIDVEGDPIFYYVATSSNPDIEVSVVKATGVVTVTPKNGYAGVGEVFVGVAAVATLTQNTPLDTQSVPVLIKPLAPLSVDLVNAYDSGTNSGDNRTQYDNSSPSKVLQFDVSGVKAGAVVEIYAGTGLIGQATAAGASVTVTTNGTVPIALGDVAITARQKLNQNLDAGNRTEAVSLLSAASPALTLTIGRDWQNSGEPLDVDNVDGVVPLDALIVINELNAAGPYALGPAPGPFYFDVDGDGSLTPSDAITVINFLNTSEIPPHSASTSAQQSAVILVPADEPAIAAVGSPVQAAKSPSIAQGLWHADVAVTAIAEAKSEVPSAKADNTSAVSPRRVSVALSQADSEHLADLVAEQVAGGNDDLFVPLDELFL